MGETACKGRERERERDQLLQNEVLEIIWARFVTLYGRKLTQKQLSNSPVVVINIEVVIKSLED